GQIHNFVLSQALRMQKSAMLACHASQSEILGQFPVDVERFRIAPVYEFTAPPHSGMLYYEQFAWGLDGACWCALAQDALAELGLSGPL
ncbi:MAG: hypothetical protein ACREP6_14475, partial [Candidatus Binataceae bacterium]